MKKTHLLLLLFAAVLMLFSVFGCAETAVEEPPVDEAPVEEAPVEEVALDAEVVLVDAAVAYFDHVAAGNNNMTNYNDIKAMVDADPESYLIIDMRTAEDFEAGHIPGSVFADRGEVAALMSRIPQDKPVFIACFTGQNAGYTAAYLRMAGFENVTTMLYGITIGWVEQGGFSLDETGMMHLDEMPEVSAPATPEEEIIWARAAEYGAEIAEGKVGFIALDAHEEFYNNLQADPASAVMYDIRAATGGDHDYDKYHIEHSVNVPFGKFGSVLGEIPTDVPVVLGCYSGQTAAQTLGVLRMLGFDNARSLLYGIRDGWVQKNDLPVVTP
jgi:rhodanese-related sulfurtransferase